MDKNKRKQKNIGPLKRYIENKAKQNAFKTIRYSEKKNNRKLSQEERNKIYIKEQKKLMAEYKKKFNRFLAAGVLAVSSFFAGTQYQKNHQLFLADTSRTEVTSEASNETNKFRDSIKVTEKEMSQSQKDEIKETVNSLKTPDKILTYLKDLYVAEYNAEHNDNITSENVSFSKNILDISVREDVAQNGDKIYRYSHNDCTTNINIDSILHVTVSKDKKTVLSEIMTYADDQFVNVYSENEEVASNGKNSFSQKPELGTAINSGLSYFRAFNEYKENGGSDAYEYAKYCKQVFTEYLTEYYKAKINENQSPQNEGIEPGE